MVSSTTGKALVGALLAVAVLSAGGCKRGSTDLERWVVDVKSRPAPPLDPLPVTAGRPRSPGWNDLPHRLSAFRSTNGRHNGRIADPRTRTTANRWPVRPPC